MCGIAGIVALDDAAGPSREQLAAMCDTIRHRGPDDEGLEVAGPVGLGMRRLSIIDVAGGRQPIHNEDGSVRVVFNGEIYNFRELRRDLELRGHRFASGSDGEVIAHLWEERGTGFVEQLNGMFAIALHDVPRRRVVLARDRLGIKPLFYARLDHHLVFGSEVKALLASGLVPRELDLDALGQLLAWEYVPAPRTLLRDVRKLDSARLLEIDLDTGRATTRAYWDVPPASVHGNGTAPRRQEWIEALDAKIAECVKRQLVSDVPLGAFLSGGVDSSLVVAAMGEAETFSIGFDDPSYNELAWSQRVADHLGVRHETEVIRPDVVELFDRLMHFMDDPIGDFSIFPTFLVSRLARRHVTVALSGDGGDELFGGYETYVAQQKARLWGRVPAGLRQRVIARAVEGIPPRPEKKGIVNKIKRFVEGAGHDAALGHARWRLFVGDEMRRSLFTPEALGAMGESSHVHILRLFEQAGRRSDVDRCLFVDLKSYLSDNCLVKVDRMSMACSLEARVPLLDHELVELAFRVPPQLKVRGSRTKVLLKRVAARHVPEACVYRPKEGFSIPIKHWLGNEFAPLINELLDPRRLAAEGLFDVAMVRRLREEHDAGRANHSHVLWSMMVFQDWRRRWAA
jgi:asparagine synthase (glutamine-hydrolysing)